MNRSLIRGPPARTFACESNTAVSVLHSSWNSVRKPPREGGALLMQWKATVGLCALLCLLASTASAQPFMSTDVGAVGASGHSSLSGGTWTVNASGADIWDKADSFHFVHQTATG